MSSGHSHDIQKEIRTYWIVFAALIICTFLTVLIAQFHFPLVIAVTLALTVAVFKGSLVCGFFMHLISERQLIYTILIFTVSFFIGLIFLPLYNDGDRLIGTHNTGKEQQLKEVLEKKAEGGHSVH